MYCSQKSGEDFAKFCGLLKIYELYNCAKNTKDSLLAVKLIYSEKATKVCTVDKSKVEISHIFVAFSEYTNFKLMDFQKKQGAIEL